ncbi:STAS-like domain-containing protein [Nostoc sp. CENA67]|uniref:STAS-like domain-containing protein n=1 Tax=Amazonocrinis nigriterrae CENA67 TaxID=2794033 RepID=A0A8J7HRL4_9NOST|nr:STAS-like domain-containing protein [Amazonocrinis nigriterrae]MBH8562770.1 STAS-like domain-containing protein [Amazonocrinis nigriterrae CENA67]
MVYKIFNIVGEYAITAESGQNVYDQIHPVLLAGNSVELDFTGVKVFASLFFNFAIGQLLKDIPADKLNQQVEFIGISSDGWNVLERVITNAKHYYSDERFRNAVDTVMAEQAATL